MNKIKRCLAFALGVLLAFSTPFATATCLAKEYEDKYAENGKIESRIGEGYEALYEVNNHAGMSQHVIMYFLVQDKFSVDQNDFTYQFEGKFNPEDVYGTHLFEFNLGSPIEYGVLSEVTLGEENAILHQAQFGIYPGYYNFFNYGYANFTGYGGNTACKIKTLSPNFLLEESDGEAPELWEEVEEGEDPRIYVIVGEVDWINKVASDFEAWAVEYEALTVANLSEQTEQVEEVADAPVESTENTDSSENTQDTEAVSILGTENDSEKVRNILSVNPRQYEDAKNDETIEDTQSRLEKVTDVDTKEELGSVSYVAVDGLGEPFGMGIHYKGYTVVACPAAKLGYRFVNLRASNVGFNGIEWNEECQEFRYDFAVQQGDATIYFYYEPKDYAITVDEKLAEYVTVQPYGNEGEMVPIRISEDCPYDIKVQLEDGSKKDLEIVDKITIIDHRIEDENGIRLNDEYKKAFEMYGTPITLVADSGIGVKGVLIPVAVVGVAGVAAVAVVSNNKKKKQ